MSEKAASPDFVREFTETMPHAYRYAFGPETIAQHAAIAAHRGFHAAVVGRFQSNREVGVPLCVVADDRPGLLATICAALVLEEWDVINAEAYTRRTPAGQNEAVDVFWVRPTADGPPDLTDERVQALQSTLLLLLRGGLSRLLEQRKAPPRSGPRETHVRFIEDQDGHLGTLEVETQDRPGLLMGLSRALFNHRVQIVRSEVRTEGDRVRDRFTVVELDGAAISAARRLELQVAILTAMDDGT